MSSIFSRRAREQTLFFVCDEAAATVFMLVEEVGS